jgi:type VI protein secretion system component VasF
MNDAESKLAAFWRADRPSAPDAVFRLAVMERRARRRFHVATAWIVATGVCAIALVGLLVPSLPVWTPSQTALATLPLLSIVGAGSCVTWAFLRGRQAF